MFLPPVDGLCEVFGASGAAFRLPELATFGEYVD